MKTIYIDTDYHCYVTNDIGLTAVETDFFNGKCDYFIEGYRFIPAGESWIREDGTMFCGEMVAPWKPWDELDATQRDYEQQLMAELEIENATLLSNMAQMVEEVYQSDIDMMSI